MANTSTAAPAAKARAARGSGPVTIKFVDADGVEHVRVPVNVAAVLVADKKGNKKAFPMQAINAATLHQMAAAAFKQKLAINIVNGFDEKLGNVISIADTTFEAVKNGKMYQRKEGGKGGAGRPFDIEYWMAVTKRFVEKMHANDPTVKLPSKKNLEDLGAKLLASDKAAREAWKKRSMGNPYFKLAIKEIDLEKASANKSVKAGDNTMDSVFTI